MLPLFHLCRVYAHSGITPGSPASVTAEDVGYSIHCQSDALRLSKATTVASAVVCPVDERSVSLVLTDGRVLIWDLLSTEAHSAPARMPPASIATPVEV